MAGGLKVYYIVNGRALGQQLAPGGTRVDFMLDALGSVTGEVNADGSVGDTYRYGPFGNSLLATTGETNPDFRWNGANQYCDTLLPHAEYYVRARHYSSTEGRWTTADPLWPIERAYTYAEGRPALQVDGTGLAVSRCKPSIAVPKPYPAPQRCNPYASQATAAIATFCDCVHSHPAYDCILGCVQHSSCPLYANNAQMIVNCMQDWCSQGTLGCCAVSTCQPDPGGLAPCACAPASVGPTCTVCLTPEFFTNPGCSQSLGPGATIAHELLHCCGPEGSGAPTLHACVYQMQGCIAGCLGER